MSVGAICFTSSGSNGGCWVVLVFPRHFFWIKGVFSPIRDLHQKKKITAKKNPIYAKKKVTRFTPKKKSKLCLFPQSSYAFLQKFLYNVDALTAWFARADWRYSVCFETNKRVSYASVAPFDGLVNGRRLINNVTSFTPEKRVSRGAQEFPTVRFERKTLPPAGNW